MKLSDIKGERVFDVIADLVEPIANIAEDEKALEFFRPKPLKKGETAEKAFAKRMRVAIPALLKEHRSDVIAILSTIKGQKPAEFVKDMTLASIIGDLFELLTDDVFLGFLPQSDTTEG